MGKVGEAAAVKVAQDGAAIYNVSANVSAVIYNVRNVMHLNKWIKYCKTVMKLGGYRLHKAWLHVDK